MAQRVSDIEQAAEIPNGPSEVNEKAEEPKIRVREPAPDTEIVETEKVIVLSFRSLQLIRIAALQDELINLSQAAFDSSRFEPLPPNDSVDRALKDYAEALKTYEILSLNNVSTVPAGSTLIGSLSGISEDSADEIWLLWRIFLKILMKIGKIFPSLSPSDEFLGVQTVWRDIADAQKRKEPSNVLKRIQETTGKLGFRELDQAGRISRQRKKALSERIVMAMFGGIALIGPMLIMTLHKSENTSLITVSVATFLFALILAVGATDSDGKDVLGATAAYAAVLVVFVGTSS